MTMPSTLFQFQCQGIPTDKTTIIGWLLADFPNLRQLDPLLIYESAELAILVRVGVLAPTVPSFYVSAFGSKFDLWRDPAFIIQLNIFAQAVFCVLERRGLQVRYVEGELDWETE
jgi:hypothetical protein